MFLIFFSFKGCDMGDTVLAPKNPVQHMFDMDTCGHANGHNCVRVTFPPFCYLFFGMKGERKQLVTMIAVNCKYN